LGILKKFRFSSQGSYRIVAAKGKRFSSPLLNLKVLPAQDGNSRFCFIIKKKNGCAVFRNKCRRILREIFFEGAKNFEKPLWVMVIVEMNELGANWGAFRESGERAVDKLRMENGEWRI
jgi:ribonuclease P protein component